MGVIKVSVIFPKRTSGNDYQIRGRTTGHTQMTRHRTKSSRFVRVSSVERYDPVFNVWSELKLRKNFFKMAIVRGEIYSL